MNKTFTQIFSLCFILALAIALGQSAYASNNCYKSCPTGAPSNNRELHRTIYSLSNNPTTKLADWVAYRVSPDNLGGKTERGSFKTDPDLNSKNTITKSEYDDASRIIRIDRGHQAPFASFKNHPDVQTTNYLSNITPQFTLLNQGAWKDLEKVVRKVVKTRNSTIYVVTGPVFEWTMPRLPDTNKDHLVPSGYWKVMVTEWQGKTEHAGFFFYQETPYEADYCDHFRTIDYIEKKSGLNLMAGMTNEKKIEAAPSNMVTIFGC